jgi:hypothetical protein
MVMGGEAMTGRETHLITAWGLGVWSRSRLPARTAGEILNSTCSRHAGLPDQKNRVGADSAARNGVFLQRRYGYSTMTRMINMNKNALLISTLLTLSILLMQGCSSTRVLDSVDRNCPAPSRDQLNENGFLVLQNGVTLKCQVKNYTNKMSCTGITDGKDDGWVCSNGTKRSIFVFDENGILKTFKIY